MKNKLTIGTDPEFALFSPENRIVSAIPVLERSKHEKIDLGKGAMIYFDNALAEANISPAATKAQFTGKLSELFTLSKKVLKEHRLGAVASHNFTEEECEHPAAKEFGCDPEKDVYLGGQNAYPPVGGNVFRSAGGHIHIGGIEEKSSEQKMPLVVLMDILVGIPSVLLDNDPTSNARKILYGKAGRYRDTAYGLEYRTLSNFWLSTPELSAIIFDLTIFTAELFLSGEFQEVFKSVNVQKAVDCINSSDKVVAKEIFDTLPIPQKLKEQIEQLSKEEYNPDIFSNWKI